MTCSRLLKGNAILSRCRQPIGGATVASCAMGQRNQSAEKEITSATFTFLLHIWIKNIVVFEWVFKLIPNCTIEFLTKPLNQEWPWVYIWWTFSKKIFNLEHSYHEIGTFFYWVEQVEQCFKLRKKCSNFTRNCVLWRWNMHVLQ